jgi:hypothetical protein
MLKYTYVLIDLAIFLFQKIIVAKALKSDDVEPRRYTLDCLP